jgi:transcriptional regulator with XRE-family HTH domain
MTTQRYERIPEWTVGDRLRKARMITGLSTAEFAERLGVSQKTVNNAEADKHAVRKITFNAWSLATGIPVEWLEHGTEPQDGGDGGNGGTVGSDYGALRVAA